MSEELFEIITHPCFLVIAFAYMFSAIMFMMHTVCDKKVNPEDKTDTKEQHKPKNFDISYWNIRKTKRKKKHNFFGGSGKAAKCVFIKVNQEEFNEICSISEKQHCTVQVYSNKSMQGKKLKICCNLKVYKIFKQSGANKTII